MIKNIQEISVKDYYAVNEIQGSRYQIYYAAAMAAEWR